MGHVCLTSDECLTEKTHIIEPSKKFKGEDQMLLGRTLTLGTKDVPIRVLNLSDNVKHIYPGTIVETMTPIDKVMSTQTTVRQHGKLPSFLEDLYERTVKHLK